MDKRHKQARQVMQVAMTHVDWRALRDPHGYAFRREGWPRVLVVSAAGQSPRR